MYVPVVSLRLVIVIADEHYTAANREEGVSEAFWVVCRPAHAPDLEFYYDPFNRPDLLVNDQGGCGHMECCSICYARNTSGRASGMIGPPHSFTFRSRKALLMTETELRLIAAPASATDATTTCR